VSTTAKDWVVSLWIDKSDTTTAWTPPAGVPVRDSSTGTGSGRYGSLVADSGGGTFGGTYPGLTATTNANSNRAIMWSITLRPTN
jgi:hypothetical protein